MARKYSNKLKKTVARMICIDKESTSCMSEKSGIPLKTIENWVTSYNKDHTCFDRSDDYYLENRKKNAQKYSCYSLERLVAEIKQRDSEIMFLKSIIRADIIQAKKEN